MATSQRHPARDQVAHPFEKKTDLNEAWVKGYQQGKKDASLSWGGKFWVAVIMCFVGIPLLLGWFALVSWLLGLL